MTRDSGASAFSPLELAKCAGFPFFAAIRNIPCKRIFAPFAVTGL